MRNLPSMPRIAAAWNAKPTDSRKTRYLEVFMIGGMRGAEHSYRRHGTGMLPCIRDGTGTTFRNAPFSGLDRGPFLFDKHGIPRGRNTWVKINGRVIPCLKHGNRCDGCECRDEIEAQDLRA